MKLIASGAESNIYRDKGKIIKERIRKNYRIEQIDTKLRHSRTKLEFSLLKKAYENRINVPQPISISKDLTKIVMKDLGNKTFKDNFSMKFVRDAAKTTAKMHNLDIIHGDLTTANMIIKDGKLFLIDFGLGFFSRKSEDKATDIFLFKNALKAKHTKHFERAYRIFLNTYKKYSNNSNDILSHLKQIEERRRYAKQG